MIRSSVKYQIGNDGESSVERDEVMNNTDSVTRISPKDLEVR